MVTNQSYISHCKASAALAKQRLISHSLYLASVGRESALHSHSEKKLTADKGSTMFYQRHLETKPPWWPQKSRNEMGELHSSFPVPQSRSNMRHFSHAFVRNIHMSLPNYNGVEKSCLPCG